MKKYLVITTSGVSYWVNASKMEVHENGHIKLIGDDKAIVAAFPHGAHVMEHEKIVPPEKTSIHKV